MRDVKPSCPRCGYDLSGEIASWDRLEPARCPVELTCSECGHGFLCRDALNPLYGRLKGFWEHEPRRRLLIALVRTLGWLVVPFLFWRRVKLHHEVRLGRMFSWAIGMPLGVVAVSVCIEAAAMQMVTGGLIPPQIGMTNYGQFYPLSSDPLPDYLTYKVFVMIALLWPMLVYPVMLTVLDTSRRMAKLRFAHLVRATTYGVTWLAAYVLIELGFVVWFAIAEFTNFWQMYARMYSNMSFGHLLATASVWMWYYIWAWFYGSCLLWIAWYWNRAIVASYRMHMGWVVWFLLSVIVFLPIGMITFANYLYN